MPHIALCAIAAIYALMAGQSAASDNVTATQLDGTAITGRLTDWDDDHILLATENGDERLATKLLIALRWQTTQSAHGDDGADASTQVDLIDGSTLPIRQFQVVGSSAKVKLAAELNESQSALSIPLKSLASVHLQRLDPPLERQWNEILAEDFPSDVLVTLGQDGKSLDYYEGVIGEISPEQVEFKYDGESNDVDRAKVAGVIYYRGRDKDKADTPCVVHGHSGLRAHIAKVKLAGKLLDITTVAGVNFEWPIDDVSFTDFSAGKIAYLSDLEPASRQWRPFVELPTDATQVAQYGALLRDHSAFGGPLSVLASDAQAATNPRQIKMFGKGLALRSRTELVFRLPSGYRRFIALAGIDPAASVAGNVRLTIFADDDPLFEADIAGDQPAKDIEIDISGMKRLKIVVDFGANLDLGDWLNLCDARLVK